MEVVAILDMSGSMERLTNDTIQGLNLYLDELRKDTHDVRFTLITFEEKSNIVWEHRKAKECPSITRNEYHPEGDTALTDAIGIAIDNMKAYIQKTRKMPGKVSFFITTDGEENSSKKYGQRQIKEMIERQTEEDKWDFVFAGANIDAFAAG